MAVRVTSSFLLKGVDPNKVLEDYRNGVYTRESKKKSIITVVNKAIIAPTYGDTNESAIYCTKDRHNCSVIIATSNHANYEIFTKTGGELPTGGRCRKCMKDFTHTVLGYPLAMQERSILMNAEGSEPIYRIIYAFWTEGTFCSFECTAGYVQQILSHPADHRDTSMRDSYSMLCFLYRLTHPKEGPLRPAQDPSLLLREGGSLTEEQWGDKKHIFVRTNRVVMIPIKVEYIQQNFLEPSIVSHV